MGLTFIWSYLCQVKSYKTLIKHFLPFLDKVSYHRFDNITLKKPKPISSHRYSLNTITWQASCSLSIPRGSSPGRLSAPACISQHFLSHGVCGLFCLD